MKLRVIILAASVAVLPLTGALATTAPGATAGVGTADTSDMREDDDDFPWGLLGLLGLAGLLGRKRNDDHIARNGSVRG